MTEPERVSLLNVPKTRSLMLHAAAAIHHVTILQDKPASLRTAALHGIDLILDDGRLFNDLLLHHFKAVEWKTSQYMHVGLKTSEVTVIKECQRYIGMLVGEPIARKEAFVLGLLRMARPEFGWHPNMTTLNI